VILADLIKKAYKYDGVVTAYIYGDFGQGKTSYALWVAYNVLGSWDKVLDHLFFDPEEAVKVMGEVIRKGDRLKLVIMDDAGLWLDRLTWWEEKKVTFMNFFNLIRSVAAGVLFTTPSQELPKQILNKCMFRVSVRYTSKEEVVKFVGEDGYREIEELIRKYSLKPVVNVAVGYKLRMLPSFTEFVSKEFYDFYPLHYPIHEEYERKRRKALEKYFRKWEEEVNARETAAKKLREDLYVKAREMLMSGVSDKEVLKYLRNLGIPQTTAFRWVKKLKNELEGGVNA
jgi:hypothetical protein